VISATQGTGSARELIPYLEKHFNPQLVATLAREALLAHETWSLIESQAQDLFEVSTPGRATASRCGSQTSCMCTCPSETGFQAGLAGMYWIAAGITSAHIQGLLTLLRAGQSGAQIQLPHGCVGLRQFDAILLSREARPKIQPFTYELQIPRPVPCRRSWAVFESAICRHRTCRQ